jgi:outer membrane protein
MRMYDTMMPAGRCIGALGLLLAVSICGGPWPSLAADAPPPASILPPAVDSQGGRYTLDSIIRYGLKNNPRVRIAGRDVETETYGIESAKSDRMPKLDFGGGVTRYRYETPLTPIVITFPLTPSELPEFKRTIWDTGLSFKLPLFRGGRLIRNVNVAEMKKAVAEDMLRMTKQDLVYNLSSVFYKIAQLEKLLVANDASVKQLEAHKRNVELFFKTGTAPRLDLLKTEVELSHARESRLLVKNNLASAYELLKNLMGMDDMAAEISIAHEQRLDRKYTSLEESLSRGFSQRPDFKAAAKKVKMSEQRVKIARARRYPDIYAAGQYGGQAGNDFAFKENYYLAVKFSVPVFDGGLISSEIDKERTEHQKAIEEERSLRLSITRDIRDAHLSIANARERVEVTEAAIESARENLRVEVLKYDTGAGTSTDVIDARTAMLRAEADYFQALFDKETAIAYLKKATGEEWYEEEAGK